MAKSRGVWALGRASGLPVTSWVWDLDGLGFRVWGLGFRVWGLGFWV